MTARKEPCQHVGRNARELAGQCQRLGAPRAAKESVRCKERRREGQTVRDLVVRPRRGPSSSTGDGQSLQGGAGERHDPRVTRAAPWGQSVGKEGSGETLRHCCVVQMRECGTRISAG